MTSNPLILDDAGSPPHLVPPADVDHRPVLIEVSNLSKTFRIPEHRVDTIKERVAHPLTKPAFSELRALRDISFEVRQGEFFGIVGRNGSGKSTLLKLLSSIYRPDSGRIRMAGRLAPFIELGVGFNTDLTARENVALNGVMMGLGRREAAQRLDAVLDFAELRDYTDLKLKNYSSGMLVRLAFAAMVEADADIMLVDEVLAVGDASFAQKCMEVFREKRRSGKTLVLVTHDMAAVQSFCDRAMLIHDGHLEYLGDPEETALRYLRLNFGGAATGDSSRPREAARVVESWLQDDQGQRIEQPYQDERFSVHVVFEALDDLLAPGFGFSVLTPAGVPIYGFGKMWSEDDEDAVAELRAGERIHISARLENPLVPNEYVLSSSVSRDRTAGDIALRVPELLRFRVRGRGAAPVLIEEHQVGMIAVRNDIEATLEPESA